MVLQALKDTNLQIKSEKSVFYTKKVQFLEFIITLKGIQINPDKIRFIMKWSTLTDIKEVQLFLKFTNFY